MKLAVKDPPKISEERVYEMRKEIFILGSTTEWGEDVGKPRISMGQKAVVMETMEVMGRMMIY